MRRIHVTFADPAPGCESCRECGVKLNAYEFFQCYRLSEPGQLGYYNVCQKCLDANHQDCDTLARLAGTIWN